MTSGTITRTLEPNLTFFSAAELRVVSFLIINFIGMPVGVGPFHSRSFSQLASICFFLQVVLPIGEIPDDVFQRYTSLIMTHRKVWLLCSLIFSPVLMYRHGEFGSSSWSRSPSSLEK